MVIGRAIGAALSLSGTAGTITVFLLRRDVARQVSFPAMYVVSRDDCRKFEHRPGHLMAQVLAMGYKVRDLNDGDARIMWDSHHECDFNRWTMFDAQFGNITVPQTCP